MQITSVSDGFVDVACEEGNLRLLEVEIKQQVFKARELTQSIRERFA